MLVALDTEQDFSTRAVGGKAASLIQLKQAGFRVPHGVVLTTDFFTPWFFEICANAECRMPNGDA